MYDVCDLLYALLYVSLSCFVVRGYAVSRRYIKVCYSDVYSIVNMYLGHFKLPTPCLVRPIGAHGGEDIYFKVCLL